MREDLGLQKEASIVSTINALIALRMKAVYDNGTFQSELYFIRLKERIQGLPKLSEKIDPSLNFLVIHRSVVNKTAGMWLRTHCGNKDFQLNNLEICTGLCVRYLQEIPYLENQVHQCSFCKNNKNKVDRFGHHYISGCASDVNSPAGTPLKAQRHAAHDRLRYALYNIAKKSGVFAVQEKTGMFDESNLTPADVYLEHRNGVAINTKTAADLAVVGVLGGSQGGKLFVEGVTDKVKVLNDKEKLHDRRANKVRDGKNNKYQQACLNIGVNFVPFIMSTTGKIHKDGVALLNKLADHASEIRHIDQKTLFRYYKKILSVTLIKEITRCAHVKSVARATRCQNPQYMVSLMRQDNLVTLDEACQYS